MNSIYHRRSKVKCCFRGNTPMNSVSDAAMKRSRVMYLIEAALEYLISLLVTGSFLASLTKELEISDSLTGILSSVISLGCLFQLFSLTVRVKRSKGFVISLSIINQLLFLLLYVVPFFPFSSETKIVLFVVLIILAYFIYNVAHPRKISWLMSTVEDRHRGRFTANKEIISLISEMAFSFGMGAVVDYFSGIGQMRIAFMISAGVIFLLMVFHSLSMLFTAEKILPQSHRQSPVRTFCELMQNKDLRRVIVIFLLYYVSTYVSVPFYGTYQIGELGLSLAFVSAITIGGSVSRILVSKFWGSYADKNSFAAMIEKCFIFYALSQLCVIFAVPSNGMVTFLLYYILHGIALGGLSSALVNLIFDYVPVEKRADSLAITQAFAGLTGFSVTLLVSPLVSHIQSNGNTFFGIPLYAQQLVTILAFFTSVVAVIYTRITFMKKKN